MLRTTRTISVTDARGRSALAAVAFVLLVSAMSATAPRAVARQPAATGPAPAPAPAEPTEAGALEVVKAYHALLVAGEAERAVREHFHVDQILLETFEDNWREAGTDDRRRLRELFFPVMEPVMAHPAMKQATARS